MYLKKKVQLVTQRARGALNLERERLDVLCFINKESFPLLLSIMKQLRGNILSAHWHGTAKCLIAMHTYQFDSSNKKHMRDFLKDGENSYLGSLRKRVKHLRINEKLWWWRLHPKYIGEMSNYMTDVLN